MALNRRPVVTAFIQRATDGTVLLLQRSDAVSTYQGHFAAVSGAIEARDNSRIARCLEEIFEEVGFCKSELTLRAIGRPLPVDDGSKHFIVHPYLFETTTVREPILNWENDEAVWINPSKLSTLEHCVPKLSEAWGRVHLRPETAKGVAGIRDDREHGAAELARMCLDILEGEVEILLKNREQDYINKSKNVAYILATARPSMSAPAAVLAAALDGALKESAFLISLQKSIQNQQKILKTIRQKLISEVDLQLRDGMTLLTLSLSSSVRAAIGHAAQTKKLKAVVCESRPLFEGVALAEAWQRVGIECTLITDAAAGIYLDKDIVDMVIIGADSITQSSIVNKAGTLLITLAAREKSIPVYAITETSKCFPSLLWQGESEEEMDSLEVVSSWTRGAPCHVENKYFDSTPLEYFQAIITENGPLTPKEVAELTGELEKSHSVFYGDG